MSKKKLTRQLLDKHEKFIKEAHLPLTVCRRLGIAETTFYAWKNKWLDSADKLNKELTEHERLCRKFFKWYEGGKADCDVRAREIMWECGEGGDWRAIDKLQDKMFPELYSENALKKRALEEQEADDLSSMSKQDLLETIEMEGLRLVARLLRSGNAETALRLLSGNDMDSAAFSGEEFLRGLSELRSKAAAGEDDGSVESQLVNIAMHGVEDDEDA